MSKPGRDERDFEAFLADPDEGWEGVAALLGSVRANFQTEVDPDVRAQHIAAIMAEAGTTPSVVPLAVRRRRFLRVAAVAVAASISMSVFATGLAYAGVITMPQPARAVLQRIGITLPTEKAPKTVVPSQRPEQHEAEAPPSAHPTSTKTKEPNENANERARKRGDNADERAERRGDDAEDPGHQRDDRGDNADEHADDKGDNADDRKGDRPDDEGEDADGDQAQ